MPKTDGRASVAANNPRPMCPVAPVVQPPRPALITELPPAPVPIPVQPPAQGKALELQRFKDVATMMLCNSVCSCAVPFLVLRIIQPKLTLC